MKLISHLITMIWICFLIASCASRQAPLLDHPFKDRSQAAKISIFYKQHDLEESHDLDSQISHFVQQGIGRLSAGDFVYVQIKNQPILSEKCPLICIFDFAQKNMIKELMIVERRSANHSIQMKRYQAIKSLNQSNPQLLSSSSPNLSSSSIYQLIASEELILSDLLKDQDKIQDKIQGKIQAKILHLFLSDHPSLQSKINRLEKNIYFEKMSIDELDASHLQKQFPPPPLQLKSNQQIVSIKLEGIGQLASLKNVNLDLLESYDLAINEEKNPNILPAKKYENWQKLKSINTYPPLTQIIEAKLSHWAYEEALWFDEDLSTIKQKLKKWEDFQKQYPKMAQDSKVETRIAELKAWLVKAQSQEQVYLKFYQDLLAWDQKRNQKRQDGYNHIIQMQSSPNLSTSDQIDWINAWIESFGAHPLINPNLSKLKTLNFNFQEMEKAQLADDLIELSERTKWIKIFPYEFWDQHGTSILSTILQSIDPTNPQEITFEIHGMTMVKMSGGSFDMKINTSGNPQALRLPVPSAHVHLKSFYISKHEVTVAQYQKCIDAKVCLAPTNEYLCNLSIAKDLGTKKYQDHPMNCITWENARQFAKWMGGDLPSEAQWTYAAQSQGQDILYPWGNEPRPNCDFANTNYSACNLYHHTSAVCTYPLGNSQQGLCDLIGNVREFVLDEVDEYEWAIPQNALKNNLLKIPTDGQPLCQTPTCATPGKAHITRGGDFFAHFNDEHVNHETFHIAKNQEQSDLHLEGFRIVRMIKLDD